MELDPRESQKTRFWRYATYVAVAAMGLELPFVCVRSEMVVVEFLTGCAALFCRWSYRISESDDLGRLRK